MAFATLAAIDAEIRKGHGIRHGIYQKVPVNPVVSRGYSFWQNAGNPGPGAVPTLGKAGAVATSKATAGAIQFDAAPAGQNNYLFRVGQGRQSSQSGTFQGFYILVDRLAHVLVSHAEATGAISPALDATARLASGEGGLIMIEVETAFNAASNAFNLTYTNESGTSGRITPDITTVASAAAFSSPYAINLFVPLQAGDRGVRSISDFNLVSGSGTGQMLISVNKPLALIPAVSFAEYGERDCVAMCQNFIEIHDDACLSFFYLPISASNALLFGDIEIIQG